MDSRQNRLKSILPTNLMNLITFSVYFSSSYIRVKHTNYVKVNHIIIAIEISYHSYHIRKSTKN